MCIFILLLTAVLHASTQQTLTRIVEIRSKAENGDAAAQAELGAYLFNAGNYTEAKEWSQKAADQGNALGQYTLGYIYYNAHGVRQNYPNAAYWFRKAAEQNFAPAQECLGTILFSGTGVDVNKYAAAGWFLKAAEQGQASAQRRIGLLFLFGEGREKDYKEGARWIQRSAEQGDEVGQYWLGYCYMNAKGLLEDYVQAYSWLILGSANGEADAVSLRNELRRLMTPEQIAQGQELARTFKPRRSVDRSEVLPPNRALDSSPSASGTGFFITENGFLVTNEHVIREATQIRLVTNAGVVPAEIVKVDMANDLALLKAEGRYAALPVAVSRSARLGSTVATIGFPNIGLQGFAPKLAKGEIASLSGAQDDPRYFQISVPVQPGNSGGALVDELGNVVGVVSAKLSAAAALETSGQLPENVNYAIKSIYLLGFLESMPQISTKLKVPNTITRTFEDIVKSAEKAAVLVLVYK
ncbi:SEL1-like repeat protein [Candidatus Bathyarchaeota archaeon]|nr:SEL1-like repeat protein [Candidatus Bathyarchaeota archaeon]